jgi:hypothetical protein
MKILWNNVEEHETVLLVITKGSAVFALEIGLKWKINYGDWYYLKNTLFVNDFLMTGICNVHII